MLSPAFSDSTCLELGSGLHLCFEYLTRMCSHFFQVSTIKSMALKLSGNVTPPTVGQWQRDVHRPWDHNVAEEIVSPSTRWLRRIA